jgi:hypothetical protein
MSKINLRGVIVVNVVAVLFMVPVGIMSITVRKAATARSPAITPQLHSGSQEGVSPGSSQGYKPSKPAHGDVLPPSRHNFPRTVHQWGKPNFKIHEPIGF